MKRLLFLSLALSLFLGNVHTPDASIKALIGGRLIDGFGGKPLANSVILIEGDRIKMGYYHK